MTNQTANQHIDSSVNHGTMDHPILDDDKDKDSEMM